MSKFKEKLQLLGFKTYKEYLKSFHWKSFSSHIKQIRKYCEICGLKKLFNVHHLIYDNLGAEKEEDVKLLCEDCHYELHFGKKKVKKKNQKKRKWSKRQLKSRCLICNYQKRYHFGICRECYDYFFYLNPTIRSLRTRYIWQIIRTIDNKATKRTAFTFYKKGNTYKNNSDKSDIKEIKKWREFFDIT